VSERKRALGPGGIWGEPGDATPKSAYIAHELPDVDAEQVAAMGIRRFVLNRSEDLSGTSGVGVVAEGVRFSDGVVALHWITTLRSTAVYNSVDELVAIHGHDGATQVVWADG
jgi:hypothetical protein